MGLDAASIAQHLRQHGYAGDEDRNAVEIWECHADALAVYQRCQWTVIAGAGGAAYLGIASQEIESASRALCVPFSADLIDDVHGIARGAAEVLNERKS